MNQLKIAGCDCGKDSLHVCVMTELPSDLKRYTRSYKPKIYKANAEDVQEFLSLDVDLYVLEPTGAYSYVWIDNLTRAGKAYKLVSSRRVRHFCEYQGVINKADRPDAAAIAAYSYQNYFNPKAFLGLERLRIKDLYLQAASTARNKNPISNRIGQRLTFELPEFVKTFEGAYRGFLDPVPTAYRWLAGEETKDAYSDRRNRLLLNTIGSGLSAHTRALAGQLCEFERIELELDRELELELAKVEFEAYHRVMEPYQIPPRVKAAILSRIYPFEDFLRDGKAVKEYIRGEKSRRPSGMTKRDRSEGEFKTALGMGKERYQSGGKESFKASGAKYARTALWQYVKTTIVMQMATKNSSSRKVNEKLFELEKELKEPVSPWLNQSLISAAAELMNCSEKIATLRLYYLNQQDKEGNRKVMATAGKFTRMLYKDLRTEFSNQ